MKRALLSVFNKSGITELASALHDAGVELISSGGTAKVIAEAGLPVVDVADYTGSPIMLGHRVVTLHPRIHGGILADRNDPEHVADLDSNDIAPIDLVVGNLYPFASEPSMELIDIGGPTMVRAAAKNFEHVGVVVDPDDYDEVAQAITEGTFDIEHRQRLARKAFAHTAAYDAAIVQWFDQTTPPFKPIPDTFHLSATTAEVLRYGENPHQQGVRFRIDGQTGWWDSAVQHNGKKMSYLNVYDSEAAWQLVWNLGTEAPAAVVIKHANPCGAATGDNIADAYRLAHACDSTSAFGGIIALNQPLDLETATAIGDVFTEVVIAPKIHDDALAHLKKRENLRVLEAPRPNLTMHDVRSLDGGFLIQTSDRLLNDPRYWEVATDREPTMEERADLAFAWAVAARVSSNAIVLVKDRQAVGIGAGQQNRRDAGRIAAEKANGRATGGACASDAFFPFADGLEAAIDAGCTAVIQPGGSIRDAEIIEAANAAGLAMVLTGERHFKH